MFNRCLTAYIMGLLLALVNPAFAEEDKLRVMVEVSEPAKPSQSRNIEEPKAAEQGAFTNKAVDSEFSDNKQAVNEPVENEPVENEQLTEKESQQVTTNIAEVIASSMSQQQTEASTLDETVANNDAPENNAVNADPAKQASANSELPQASFLEVMEALAQFGDEKKLAEYIKQYYQQNPEVAQNKYPNLAYDAAITGMQNLLNYLIKHNPEKILLAYEGGPTVLGYIAGDNQVEAARRLLENRLDPNDPGNTDAEYPLSMAINSGNLQMITLLMDYRAKVHIGDRFHSPLALLLDNNDLQILNVIHAYDFRLESTDAELVRLLIDYLNSELVEEEVLNILITHGFDPYQENPEGKDFFAIAGEQVKTKDVLAMLRDIANAAMAADENKGAAKTSPENAPVTDEKAVGNAAAGSEEKAETKTN